MTEPNLVLEAREAAIFRLQEILKHPDDLVNKLSLVRKKLIAERASIDAQLRTAVETQLEDIEQGMNTLRNSGDCTSHIHENLQSIDGQWAGAKNNINNYGRIKKISRTHQNFIATKHLIEQFQRLNAQVERVHVLLTQDLRDPFNAGDNLLFLHYQLKQLETFKDSTLLKARKSPLDVVSTLQHYFEKVDELSEAFERHIWAVGSLTLDFVKSGRTSTTIKLVKIIETEERADEQAAVVELGSSDEFNEYSSPKLVKAYRVKFFDVLREAIGKQIRELYERFSDDLPQLLQACEAIVDDLIIIHDELEPRLPKRYNIFQFFVLEYHRCIYDMVNHIISTNMEAGSILLLLRWVRDYYSSMNGRLGVGEELLEPRILDDREEELILDYIKLVRQKLSEWLNNLLNTETRDFLERAGPPDTDGNGIYLLSGSVIVFQMFNQQVDVVAQSSRGPLIYDVIVECCNALEEFQKAWTKILEREYQKFCDRAPDLAEGLPEYIVSLSNDSLRGTEFSDVMSARLESMVDEPFRTQAALKVKSALNGFMAVARRGYGILIDIIVKDLQPALIRLYCNEWYEQDLMRLIVGTLEDYLLDFQEHMQEYLFSKFTGDLQDRMVLACVEALRNKGAKLRMTVAVDKMKSDLEMIIEFFSRFKSSKRVKAAFEIMEKIISFIESNDRLIFLDFYALWKAYPDVPLTFIEELLQKRDDLDRGQIRDIMEQCKTRVAEEKEKLNGKDMPASIFSKFK